MSGSLKQRRGYRQHRHVIFRRNAIYLKRLFWWYPWGITDWWRPRAFRGGDEWCNDSWAFIIPPFGGFVIFWRRNWRTLPCTTCWAELDEASRADYTSCGYLYNGRLNEAGHHHTLDGACENSLIDLASYEFPE